MKVVIDTNIPVSAFVRDRDPELVVQFVVDHLEFKWAASQPVLTEYKDLLQRTRRSADRNFGSRSSFGEEGLFARRLHVSGCGAGCD